jgi:NADH-quinone oxidoreductase subunit L
VLAIVGLVAAFMTAFYMFRLVFKVFFGKENFDPAEVHPHESPATMTGPLVTLAAATIVAGFIGFPPEDGPFHHFTDAVFQSHAAEDEHAEETASLYVVNDGGVAATSLAQEGATDEESAGEEAHAGEHHVSTTMTVTFGVISTAVALGGIILAYLYYMSGRFSAEATAARFNGIYTFLYNKWWFDEIYDRRIVKPLYALAMFLWKVVDVKIIDGTVNGIARLTTGTSQQLRRVQTGVVSNYALAIALGTVVIIGVYLVGFSSLEVPFIR